MAKLERVLKQLNGTEAKEKQALDKSLSDAVGTNTSALSKQIEGMLVQFFGKSNESTLKISQSVANEIGKLILGTHNNLNERIQALEAAEEGRHERSQEMLKQLLGSLEQTVMTSLRDTEKRVANLAIPGEVDLDPLGDQLGALSTQVANIKIPEVKIPAIPKRKESFEFRIKRDDEGLIEKVLVQ